jgi:PPOX class probable F420-dependent enzyme
MSVDDTLASLGRTRYAQLRTFRRDGRAVDVPIWFALDGEVVVFRTKQGPKTRRISADANVELWPCDARGRYPAGVRTVRGRAKIVDGPAAEAANAILHRRYGWQYNVVPLLRLPGLNNVDHALLLREKLRRARMTSLWPDSAIVEVTLILDGAATEPETTGAEGVSHPEDSR